MPVQGPSGCGRSGLGMDRTDVVSSNLKSVGYDEGSETLEIEFHNGSVYQYFGVPPEEHRELMDADSHGKYLAAEIKDKYRYEKVR